MKSIRIVFCILVISMQVFSSEKVDINFKNLQIMNLVRITSKIINKNILYSDVINGKVNFISNKPVDSDDLLRILTYSLQEKGYTIVQNGEILKIVKLTKSYNSNVPIQTKGSKAAYFMITQVVNVSNIDVDLVASKIRYLLSKNGKLMTNKSTNNFVITDFKDNVKTIIKVINIMTKDTKKYSEIIKLKNTKSSDVKANLDLVSKSMFDEKLEGEKVDVIDNSINNSIVLIGKKKNVLYLKNYLEGIDKDSSLIKREVKAFPLKNVEASNILKILNEIIGKKSYKNTNNKPLFSVDTESNAIVAMGPSSELKYVENLIKVLDIEKAQVYVKARIIEVNDTKVNQIGVAYGIFGGNVNSGGLSTFSSNLNGGSSSLTDVKNLLGLKIPDITSGLALGASLNLLKQNGALNIVSEPSILAVNNKESSIYVGETISLKSGTTTTDGGTKSDSYVRKDVGLTLKVKPRISNDSKVTLDISAILEGVKTTNTASGNADTSKKEITTTAILNNGESVIIGGLIQDKVETTKQKVPLLGDIPLVGELFKNKSDNTIKNNLVVIITPYLIPKSKDITYVRNKLAKLKNMEDEYLKNALIRLKKSAINRKEKEDELDKKLRNLNKNKSEEEKRMDMLNGARHNEY